MTETPDSTPSGTTPELPDTAEQPVWRTTALSAQPTTVEPTPAPERPKRSPLSVWSRHSPSAHWSGASPVPVSPSGRSRTTRAARSPAATSRRIVNVNDADDATLITAVAAKASPSVVTISVSASAGGGTGSGVILSEDGYVLTNTHVVTLDGAVADPDIQVATNDGRLYDATIVGTDPISDLAVIKLDGATDLQPAEFADSDELNVGDTAIAIGAPLGLAGTVTNGIVSALNRSITIASSAAPEESDGTEEETPTPESPFDFWQFDVPGQEQGTPSASSTISLSVVQTDAAINPGNSGGALLDSDGNVIGINVAIASAGSSSGQSGSIGVGFAIPSNLAQRVADELIANGSGDPRPARRIGRGCHQRRRG